VKYGGLDVNEAHRLKTWEDMNCRLKHFLASAHLDIEMWEDAASEKW